MFYDNKVEEAIPEYKKIIETGLNDPTLHHRLGIALKELGKYEEAEKEFEMALSIDPLYLPTLSVYRKWLFSEGRFDLVNELTDELSDYENNLFQFAYKDANRNLALLHILKGSADRLKNTVQLINEGNIRSAILSFWPIFRVHKDNCIFIRTMVYLFFKSQWWQTGMLRLRDEFNDNETYSHYVDGLILCYDEKHEEALVSYNKAIDTGLDHPLVYFGRSLVFKNLNRTQEAFDDLLIAYNHQPWLVCVRAELADISYIRSDYSLVLELADLNPSDAENALEYDVSGNWYLACLERLALKSLMKQGSFSNALNRVENNPLTIHDAQLLFRRSMVYAANDSIPSSLAELSEAININENAIADSEEEDITLIKRISEQMPENFVTAFVYALAPAYTGNLQESRIRLEFASSKLPNSALIWYHLGNILYLLDEPQKAKEASRHAISLNTLYKDAVRLLSKLLYRENDLQGLMKLANNLYPEIFPLVYALRLEQSQGNHDQARNIAYMILDRNTQQNDPSQVDAIMYLIGNVDSYGLEYINILERLIKYDPFNFEIRNVITHRLFYNRIPAESAKLFETSVNDGLISSNSNIYSVLIYGLSFIAANTECYNPYNATQV